MLHKRVTGLVCGLVLLAASALSQTVTSTMLGIVLDAGDASVADASVQLKNRGTGEVREVKTTTEGIFRFNSIPLGDYDLTVRVPAGFKAYSQQNIQLTAAEVRDLGTIHLQVGGTTETVTVNAVTTPVQTASAEKSLTVDSEQFQRLAIRGRDILGALQLIPGVAPFTPQETTSANGIGAININGMGTGRANFSVDGVTALDTGSNTTSHYQANMDSIAEIKILTSDYQAQYGRNSSGQITVITKSGSQSFHGTAWSNKRHEMFNANSYFNNLSNTPKSVYRYFVFGYTLGGPVYIPKLFNSSKTKLFFFVSNEWTKQKPATQVTTSQMPTALERAGDFSQTKDVNGNAIAALIDPTTRTPIPGNKIPGALVANNPSAAAGLAILNFFPLPNRCDLNANAPGGCYNEGDSTQLNRRNFRSSFNEVHPLRNDTLRLDAPLTSKLSLWGRYINNHDFDQTASSGQGTQGFLMKDASGNFAPFSYDHPAPGHGYAAGMTYVISPTMVNELTVGKDWNTWDWYMHDPSQTSRAQMGNPPSFDNFATDPKFTSDMSGIRPGLSAGSQNFQANIPSVSFGASNVNQTSINLLNGSAGPMPYTNFNNVYSVQDNVSKTHGAHNFKAGLYYERTGKVQNAGSGTYLGSYNFGTSSSMPQDTGNGYANTYLGNLQNYNEGGRIVGNYWFTNLEFFVQDNWRVSRRLTLDLGVRFYHQPPPINDSDTANSSGAWVRAAYIPSQASRLYYPTCTAATTTTCPSASQRGIDPLTGAIVPFALAGTFVPGSGNPFNGMVVADGSSNLIPHSLYTVDTIVPAVRIGLAWDLFGTGKTAIRTGFGQSFNRGDGNQIMGYGGAPPITYSQNIYYTNLASIPSLAKSGAIGPISNGEIVGHQKLEQDMTASFGIQQAVGFSTVVDVSWQGAFRRHNSINVPLNPIAMYSQYNPAFYNPINVGLPANASGKELNDNYFRPMAGLGNINANEFEGSATYNALLIGIRRNFHRGLSYSFAYTFNKTMGYSGISAYANVPGAGQFFQARNYGPSYTGAPQYISASYTYDLPGISKRLHFKPLGWVTDHWSLSGVTTWQSHGTSGQLFPGFSGQTTLNPVPNFTGSAEGVRSVIVGDPNAGYLDNAGNSSSSVDFTHTFNWKAFAIPQPCSLTKQDLSCFGNAGGGSVFNVPTWVNNWDMSLMKSIPLKGEGRFVTVRADVFNAPNHTQFSGINNTITYDYNQWLQGNLVQTNNNLGRYTSARTPRQMMLSVHLVF